LQHNADVNEAKQSLRKQIRTVRAQLPAETNAEASHLIWKRLSQLDIWLSARTIHTYIGSLPGEVMTNELITWCISRDVHVIVPEVVISTRTTRHVPLRSLDDLQSTPWGGREPNSTVEVDPLEADIVIVPGVAFDRNCNRLGMGGGFYDEFLSTITAPKIGLAHNVQIVDAVPMTAQDQPVDYVITPNEIITRG
jgi:5-formyltetrahydrofolate cyclo-ligase